MSSELETPENALDSLLPVFLSQCVFLAAHTTGLDFKSDKPYQIGMVFLSAEGEPLSKKHNLNVDRFMASKMRQDAIRGVFPHRPYMSVIETEKPGQHNLRMWQPTHDAGKSKDEVGTICAGQIVVGWDAGFESAMLRGQGYDLGESSNTLDLRTIFMLANGYDTDRHVTWADACAAYGIEIPENCTAEDKVKCLSGLAVAMGVVENDAEFAAKLAESEDVPPGE